MITNLSITANDLVNICNSAPVRKNANSQPLVIVFADQEYVILTLNDDDSECQELVWRGQEGQGMLISDIGSGPKEVTLGHRAMVLQPDLT